MSFHPIVSPLRALEPPRTANPLIEPVSWEFPGVILLVALLAAAEISDWRAEGTMNYVAPVWLSFVLGVSALKMGLADHRAIWAPLFWFRAATVVSFGVGSVTPLIANDATRLYLESFYIFTSADIQRVNLVVAVGVACVLGANLVFERLVGTSEQAVGRTREIRAGDDALRIGVGMYVVGFAVNYLLVIPSSMGATSIVIPGFIVNLTAFQLVGISLLTIWAFGKSRMSLLGILLLVAFDSAVGILLFSKAMAMYPLLAFMIGMLSYRLTFARLASAALILWFVLDFLQPWVAYARNESSRMFSLVGAQAGFSDVTKILVSYFDAQQVFDAPGAIQQTLVRVSFVNSAAFVISQYDHGLPGSSLTEAVYSVIPRFLWPEKPVIHVAGDLATLATGTIGNSISAGYFAESYWNFGWIGLPLLLCPVGVVFNLATRFAARVIERKDWLYLPILFLNLRIALQVDAWYVGFVGTTAQVLGLYVALRIVGHGLRSAGLMSAPSNSRG